MGGGVSHHAECVRFSVCEIWVLVTSDTNDLMSNQALESLHY